MIVGSFFNANKVVNQRKIALVGI